MSATDIAKGIVRIATTAGLSKDVIDLLEKKLALLTDELAVVSKKLSVSESEKGHLQSENDALKEQLRHFQPAEELDKETMAVLQFFFDEGTDISVEEVASHFLIKKSLSDHRFDLLKERGFIRQTFVGHGSSPCRYGLTSKGRAFLIKSIK